MQENAEQKELVENIKGQWKKLWSERVDDHFLAEGIANNDYSLLTIEKGTIIHATRDFKALSLKEALEQNKVENSSKHIPPENQVGGWSKFIKTSYGNSRAARSSATADFGLRHTELQPQRLKKSGRGWLHI